MYAIDFFIKPFVMLLVIKGINKLKKRKAEEVAISPTDNALLYEIRDFLKK